MQYPAETIENASDQELMALLAEDDLAAWSEIVKRHTRLVFSISNQILRNASDAEDSVQNTFIRLKMYAKKFDASMPLKPWLSRIASGEAIRIYDRKKSISQKESTRMKAKEISLDSKKHEVSNKLEQEELDAMIKNAISRLPDLSRLAITLYYVGGMNQKEIARELGVSQFSISEKINYGLDKVKAMLKKSGLFTSVVLSPVLLQESLLSEDSPVELTEKIAKALPSNAQMAQMEPSTLSLAYKPVLGMKMKFVGAFFVLALVGATANFYLPQKTLEATVPVADPFINTILTKKVDIKKTVNKNKFVPVSFDDYIPVTSKVVSHKSNSLKDDIFNEIQIVDGEKTWIVSKKEDGQESVVRNNGAIDEFDGLYLDPQFDTPHMFTGKIVFNENSRFVLIFSSGVKKDLNVHSTVNENEHSNVFRRTFIASNIRAEKENELHFLIYVWPHKNKLISAAFVSAKGLPETRLVIKSLLSYDVNFRFGFLSNGPNEVSEFKACSLGRDWDFRKDENLKHFSKDFPPSYFE